MTGDVATARFEPPPFAAWRHREARDGFEVVFFASRDGGLRAHGHTAAVEGGVAFAVRYCIELDERGHTRSCQVACESAGGSRTVSLQADGDGRWTVDGNPAPHLGGCLDVDLEASAMTNAFPVHRLGLAPGESAQAPAAYVRAPDLGVERLEQHYRRVDDGAAAHRYDYSAPAFGFRCTLVYDESGLVLDYPGLAVRA